MDYIAQFRVMDPHKPATKARLLYCNLENLHEKSKSKTHSQTLLRSMFLNVSVWVRVSSFVLSNYDFL